MKASKNHRQNNLGLRQLAKNFRRNCLLEELESRVLLAGDVLWGGGGLDDHNFFTDSNWQGGKAPGPGETAIFDDSGVYNWTITVNAGNVINNMIVSGVNIALDLNGNNLSVAGYLDVHDQATHLGKWTLLNNGGANKHLQVAGEIRIAIGDGSFGEIDVSGSHTQLIGMNLKIGTGDDSWGTLSLTSGAKVGTTGSPEEGVWVPSKIGSERSGNGESTIDVGGGSILVTKTLEIIGSNDLASDAVTASIFVHGLDSRWTDAGSTVRIGHNSYVEISDGATVSVRTLTMKAGWLDIHGWKKGSGTILA